MTELPSMTAMAPPSMVVVPVRCVIAWRSNPMSPTALTIPATNASAHAPTHTQRGSLVIMRRIHRNRAAPQPAFPSDWAMHGKTASPPPHRARTPIPGFDYFTDISDLYVAIDTMLH